jgi:hypothetical protein
MPYYKFGKNDIFYNQLKAYPKVKFTVFNHNVYYNDIHQNKQNSNTPNGYINLYEMNVNRNETTHGLVYPFITKEGSLTSFKTVTATSVNTDFNYGDTLSGSYPLSASFHRKYEPTDSPRRYVDALRSTIDFHQRYSPHCVFSSSFLGRNLSSAELNLISIPSIFYGSSIRKGSIQLNYYITGTLVARLEDERRNGELIETYNTSGLGKVAGIVLYNEGFMILTSSTNIANGSTDYYEGDASLMDASWLHYFSTGSQNNHLISSSYDMTFEGTTYTPTVTMLAHAKKAELNHSNNPTFIKHNQEIQKNSVGSETLAYSWGEDPTDTYVENKDLAIKNTVKSGYNNHSASFEKQTYISRIGIYDKNRNLIAIAKLATPIRKRETDEYTFKLKLDI